MEYSAGREGRQVARHDAPSRLRRWRVRIAVAIVVAVGVVTGGLVIHQSYADTTSPAATATSADYTTDLLTSRVQASRTGGLSPILQLPASTMAAGERVLVTARLAATTNAERGPRMAIRADAVGAGQVLRSTIKSINHDGRTGSTQYVVVRWLFIAPVAGSYTITARAEATTYLEPVDTTYLNLVRDLTYLKVSNVGQSSVTWGDDNSTCVGAKAHPDPITPACGTARASVDVLTQVVQKGTATRAVVVGDVELSREYGAYPGGTYSTVEVILQATPTGADGNGCAPKVSKKYVVTITANRHHWSQNTDMPVQLSCGSKLWVKVTVKHVSGNPVAVEDKAESNGIALLS